MDALRCLSLSNIDGLLTCCVLELGADCDGAVVCALSICSMLAGRERVDCMRCENCILSFSHNFAL